MGSLEQVTGDLRQLEQVSVVRQRESESLAEPDFQDLPPKPKRESSIRSTVSDSIVTSCFVL